MNAATPPSAGPSAPPTTPARARAGDDLTAWGVVCGAFLGAAVLYLPLMWLLSRLARVVLGPDSAAGWWVVALAPFVLGLLALALPAWRRRGAGFVLGLGLGLMAAQALVWWWLATTLP